jgi:hypothetical protein
VQRLSSELSEASEGSEIKSLLEDMLKDLDVHEKAIADEESKLSDELAEHKAKLIKYETELVDLSNAADKAKQSADAADLKRQVNVCVILCCEGLV